MTCRPCRCLGLLLACAAVGMGCTRSQPVAASHVLAAEVEDKQRDGTPASADNRHALLVGCTIYPNLVDKFSELKGPANDVILTRKVLKERFGFPEANIVTLADAQPDAEHKPTRQNIQREFTRLARVAKKGHQVVILLGGHGSQQPDQAPFDELDGLDEVFLPSDAGPVLDDAQIRNAIIDDELAVWTKAITDTGASLWVIVDACHSGTMMRGDSPEVAREVPAEVLFSRGALDKARKLATERFKDAKAGQVPAPWAEEAPGLVAIYAAQSTEPTVERKPYDGSTDKVYGLLTYTLCKILTTSPSPLTYRELTQRIHSEYVRHGRAAPTPLVEGKDLDREVLGLRTWPGRSRILLLKDGDGWKVTGGRLNGLTPKSVLAVYPPAGTDTSDKPIGHVLVQAANVTDADVFPCAHAGLAVVTNLPVGGRCEPAYIDYGTLQLIVAVEGTGPHSQTLRQHLSDIARERGSLITLAANPGGADWLFQLKNSEALLSPVYTTLAMTPPAQTPARFGPYPVGDVDRIKAVLERIARARNLLTLTAAGMEEAARGSASSNAAGVAVDLTMLKLSSKDDREGTPVTWKERGAVLKPGDWVAFRVHNRARFPVDVSLLFVDSSFGIYPIFPKPGITGDNRLEPGQKYRTGPFRVNAKTFGLEHLVAIAVRGEGQPLDFTCLAQPTLELARTRGNGDRNLRSPLGQLLAHSLFNQGTTRGLGAEEIDNHALRLLSWQVEAENGKQ